MKKPKMRFNLGVLTLFFLNSTISISFAQNPHVDRLDPAALNQQGQLVNLKVIPADRNLQIFLTGKKGADIKLNNTKLSAKLRLVNRPTRELQVNRLDSYFVIPAEQLKNRDATQLELKTNVGSESEVFKIDLK